MKTTIFLLLVILLTQSGYTPSLSQPDMKGKQVSVVWQNVKPSGYIEVFNGKLDKITISEGKGKISNDHFMFRSDGLSRINLTFSDARLNTGSGTTVVSVHSGDNSFSFFLRDVTADFPIYIPDYNVIVCLTEDKRTYTEIENEVKGRRLLTNLQKIEAEPEESFDSASVHTKNLVCPTWLGISRDIRIFEITTPQDMDMIVPRMASSPVTLPETNNTNVTYGYMTGRGQGVENNRVRRLEEGVLPILNTIQMDGDIEYLSTTFVTLEKSALLSSTPIGTHYLVADNSSYGHMFTPSQADSLKKYIKEDSIKNEETVLYFRAIARNSASVPRYAWFRTLRPGSGWWEKLKYSYDDKSGLSFYSPDRVFGISLLNGQPLPDEEIAVLLQPGEEAVFEFRIPHNPISGDRALKLAALSFDNKLAECKKFWKDKLQNAASVKVPETRIEEMIRAGLLHLDLITYGKDPDGTLAPSVGVYSPIGTESSPIMQFYMSMGWNDVAKRSLDYFLDKQHEDGMIQNFGGYMVETGAALWSMGEYFRYSRDTAWVRQVEPKLLKACEFLFQWREKNKKQELLGKGYGMIDGKVADPEDQFHQFMLNGYAYIGISRVAEMLAGTDPAASARIRREADAWKKDIRTSFLNSMAGSPVVPLGNGTWCPTVPPWTEAKAMRLMYLNPETFMSHGTFTVSDAMLGPLYLVFCEVLDPEEKASGILLDYHSDLFYQRNSAFSQPYYSRHNWVQIRLGMVKPFLKTYYNTFSALADRETYTFWEHLYKVSVHKTHEEAWFLMETRWMLYLENEQSLALLPGVPRKWLENGKRIEVKNAASYFGPISFTVVSNTDHNNIIATVECNSDRKPTEIKFRIPHPEGKIPSSVTGGIYDKATETVTIKPFSGKADLRLEY
ncbi:MAG: hypothetical protein IPJ37_20605 [Bacteroidales bacterium]|nr:hypothetical protein [Bacteroidales bacterium]